MKKTERIYVRCSETMKEYIGYAAECQGKNASEYIMDLVKTDLATNKSLVKKD